MTVALSIYAFGAFWTGLINAFEVLGVSSTTPPDPGGGGSSPGTAIEIESTPFAITLPGLDGTPIWYRVELEAGDWKFSTADSPNGGFDTYLALFDDGGAVVATNEDIDAPGENYRSEIIASLASGAYYLALSTYMGGANDGFTLTAGTVVVPSGTVLKVEAA